MRLPGDCIIKFTDAKSYCMFCDCYMPAGDRAIDEHLLGRRHDISHQQYGQHFEVVRQNCQYSCSCCVVKICGWINVHPHLKGKQHTVVLNRITGTGKPLPCNYLVRNADNSYYCMICDCSCTGPTPAKDHLHGNQHRISLQKYGRDILLIKNNHHYYCRLCQCQFLGYYHVWHHVNGERHRSAGMKKNQQSGEMF